MAHLKKCKTEAGTQDEQHPTLQRLGPVDNPRDM